MSSITRFFVESKDLFCHHEKRLKAELMQELDIVNIKHLRIYNRYDIVDLPIAHHLSVAETVLSEPRTENVYYEKLDDITASGIEFAIESLPGQYDQRADSCAQCIEVLVGKRLLVRTAIVYRLFGDLSLDDVQKIKKYLINPVEARLATLEKPAMVKNEEEFIDDVRNIDGFIKADEKRLLEIKLIYGLAMDVDDLYFMQKYFLVENRNPTEAELKVLDTYWSDHCRHTTFLTTFSSVKIKNKAVNKAYLEYKKLREFVYGEKANQRPENLMDMATIACKYLKKKSLVRNLDESEEINACSVVIDVKTDKGSEEWLYMFKNETHNHPTEIEPFGGAATCLGGAIRDPLSGRSYVYQGMRISGAADPRKTTKDTIAGKLPQSKICKFSADGFSSYGNQIGLATGFIDEVYHPGYIAKRMEVGAVIAATPKANVVRKKPQPGDLVVLIGGKTGRDGCGGATGSSKTHSISSLESSGAEVQKGNPVEERKIQRLFRRADISKMIIRCNDFGAGGVSVAIGELADGLDINLDVIPKKYEGLNGIELAISESQERMACVISSEDWNLFFSACHEENILATVVATVTDKNRLIMTWRGKNIVDLDRTFLDSSGAAKHTDIDVCDIKEELEIGEKSTLSILDQMKNYISSLNGSSKRGMIEQFDSTIGAGTVLFPFGGKHLLTSPQVMAAKIPVLQGETDTTSLFAYGFDPYHCAENPFEGAYDAVLESVCKLMCAGTMSKDVYLSLQEYFPSLKNDAKRWSLPFSAVLGALLAQVDLEIPAIGGKDSMSGSFEEYDVPPTLISFATTISDAKRVISPEFKQVNSNIVLITLDRDDDNRVVSKSFNLLWNQIQDAILDKRVLSAWAIGKGGAAEGIFKMAIGNKIGVRLDDNCEDILLSAKVGSLICEASDDFDLGQIVGKTIEKQVIQIGKDVIDLEQLINIWESPLKDIYITDVDEDNEAKAIEGYHLKSNLLCKRKYAKPRVVIPVFPGTNCEYDTMRVFEKAGADANTVVISNLTSYYLQESVKRMSDALKQAQILVLPGGFSFGDEPGGSAKFIATFFREESVREAVHNLLYQQDGLILGICNGFQALVKLGLLPYGKIVDTKDNDCTLTFNSIGRHQSKYVHTKIVSIKSPWLDCCSVNEVHTIPISHGEGKFVASNKTLTQLESKGQIATQYTDAFGVPSMNTSINPNGSYWGIEGLTSEDGRILGKMGHSERIGSHITKNVLGNKDQQIFKSGVNYFKI